LIVYDPADELFPLRVRAPESAFTREDVASPMEIEPLKVFGVEILKVAVTPELIVIGRVEAVINGVAAVRELVPAKIRGT
jgi:hypothetical protein